MYIWRVCIWHIFSNVKVSMKPAKKPKFCCTVKPRISTFGITDSAKLSSRVAKTCIFPPNLLLKKQNIKRDLKKSMLRNTALPYVQNVQTNAEKQEYYCRCKYYALFQVKPDAWRQVFTIPSVKNRNKMKFLLFHSTQVQVWLESLIFNSRSLSQNNWQTESKQVSFLQKNPVENHSVKNPLVVTLFYLWLCGINWVHMVERQNLSEWQKADSQHNNCKQGVLTTLYIK